MKLLFTISILVLTSTFSFSYENPFGKEIKIQDSTDIPADGVYEFDVAFAEWEGKSMGVKVTVEISGDSIKVIYNGHGDLTANIGDILDQGIIMKHKSGKWIIGQKQTDVEIEEIGGCTGGPSIIDFKNKKFWMC